MKALLASTGPVLAGHAAYACPPGRFTGPPPASVVQYLDDNARDIIAAAAKAGRNVDPDAFRKMHDLALACPTMSVGLDDINGVATPVSVMPPPMPEY